MLIVVSFVAGIGKHLDGSGMCQALTILFLVCDLVGVLLAMMKYLLETLYASPEEHAARLLGRLPEYRREVIKNSISQKSEEDLNVYVEKCASDVFQKVPLSAEAVTRIRALPALGLRLVIAFTTCTMSLTLWSYVGGEGSPVFGDQRFGSPNCVNVLALGEQSLYSNLVTLATVGFGDMAPRSVFGRLMVDCEIIMSIFLLIFVANIVGGLVMENSGWAWNERRDEMKSYLHKILIQYRTVVHQA
jgi:hypothetical protein